jgi:hypothetical protein
LQNTQSEQSEGKGAEPAKTPGAPRLGACPRCIARGKPRNFASDPRCAFPDGGAFSPDNWMCATMNDLRDMASVLGHSQRWGDDSIGYVPLGEDMDETGFLVLLWYKDRGCTSNAMWAQEDFAIPRPLTLELAEKVLVRCEGILERQARSAPEAVRPEGSPSSSPSLLDLEAMAKEMESEADCYTDDFTGAIQLRGWARRLREKGTGDT